MKMLKFYRVDDWMITLGEGFTVMTGLLALIKSFNDNGTECNASTAYLAQFCGCSRRKIFDELRYLCEKGYITANKGKKTDIVGYTVNIEKCMAAAAEIEKEESAYAESAQALMQNLHKPYAESAQALMQNLHTEKEKWENRNEKERGETRARAESPAPAIGNSCSNDSENRPKELTEEQKKHIRYGYKFPTRERKHTADYYISLYPKYSYEKILQFLADDTKQIDDHEKAMIEGLDAIEQGRKIFKDFDGIEHEAVWDDEEQIYIAIDNSNEPGACHWNWDKYGNCGM